MNTDRFNAEINSLERKVKLLISEHEKLKQDISLYRSENEELRKRIKEKEDTLANFQNKFKISKIVDNMVVDGEEKTELRELLDNYIKEIDKCIAHLSEA